MSDVDAHDATDRNPDQSPGTAERVGYAIAYLLLLGFSVGGAVRAVADALLLSPSFDLPTTLGTIATAAVAGLLSGLRDPPTTGRVLVFSLLTVGLRYGPGSLVDPSVGDLRGSPFVAVDVGLTWLAALLLAYALVFGVGWSGPRARLRAHLVGDRGH
jgi:hypothetical protein